MIKTCLGSISYLVVMDLGNLVHIIVHWKDTTASELTSHLAGVFLLANSFE